MTKYMPHAVIVTAEPGEALQAYLEQIVQPTDEVLRIDEHPNPSKTSTGIYIEDIRDLQVTVRSAKRGVRTIVVLQDASKITPQAQNALLKLLEEPRTDLYFVLLTYTPMQLLDTIRSRCQLIRLAPTEGSIALPSDTEARIRFMAAGSRMEMQRLASDKKYFERRSQLFEAAKKFAGSSRYNRLVLVKQYGDKRDVALEFIDACLAMYTALIKANFNERLRDEAELLLAVEEDIRRNANVKLQLLRLVVQ